MPETSEIVLEILDDNKKEILNSAVKLYSKQIDDVLEWGKDALETVSNAFKWNQSMSKLSEGRTVLTPPDKQLGAPSTYASSFLPESKTDGTLEDVTRYDVKNKSDDYNSFKNVSFNIRDFSPKLILSKKATNESLRLYAGERVGIGYEKRDGYNNRFRKGLRADYNVFSNKVRLGGYYRTPNESIDASLFYKNGNYGVTAGYSNANGLSIKGAVDKNGGAVNIRHEQEYNGCYTSLGLYASSQYKTVGVTARVAF